MRHPIQPIEPDDSGVLRFKGNAIVRHLLDHSGIDLNKLERMNFSNEDREQFAQLLGYSVSGAADLGYFSEETLKEVEMTAVAKRLALQLDVSEAEALQMVKDVFAAM